MVKISSEIPSIRYSEVGQNNPLRWTILHKEADDSFTRQTALFKCKDYFNDVVAVLNGVKFAVYGFDNRILKLEGDSVYILVEKIIDVPTLLHNLEKVINPLFVESFGEPLEYQEVDKTSVFFRVPKSGFKTTYGISLLTWLIRLGAYTYKYESFKEMLTNYTSDAAKQELHLFPNVLVVDKMVEKGLVPIAYEDYWYYTNKEVNGKGNSHSAGIHNYGFKALLQQVLFEQQRQTEIA